MRRPLVLIAVVCLIGVAVAQVSAQADPRLEANKATARHDAHALLRQLQLPAGTSRSATEPAGDGAALLRPPRITAEDTVGVSAWWISHETPGPLLSYLHAHRPSDRGYYQVITEPSATASTVIFVWNIDGPRLFSQQLQVTVATLAGGQTGIMAQAESVWMVPRPRSERIPVGVHSVDVTLRIGSGNDGMVHQRTHRYAVTEQTEVTRLVGEFDSLPITQPGLVYNCPAMFPHMPLLTMRFISGAGSTLARAQVNVSPGKHGGSGWISCDPIDFWIGSRQQTALTSHTFVAQIAKLIGANIS